MSNAKRKANNNNNKQFVINKRISIDFKSETIFQLGLQS